MRLNSTTVVLARQTTYDAEALALALDRLLPLAGEFGSLRTARVLLKPNLITAGNGPLPCTEGAFLLAAARWFLNRGAEVRVGDSPSFGSAHAALARLGVADPLQQAGARLVEFRDAVAVTLPSGQPVAMAREAMECDLLVSLPRVKAHAQTRVTLAVKNHFGCVAGIRKPWWHMVHGGRQGRFADLLVELLAVLPSGLSLVDGIIAMHRSGPVHGEPYALGLVACGANPVAVDTALLQVLGIDPETSPLGCAARRAGIPGTLPGVLTFPAASPAELAVRDFAVPEALNPVRFNPFRFLKNSCRRLLLRLASR